MKAQIEGIGTYRLILDTGYHLDLEKCLYVPQCARNLVSVSMLDKLGFKFEIGNGVFSLCKNKYCYGSGALIEDLYRLILMLCLLDLCFLWNKLLVKNVVCITNVLLSYGIKDLVTYPRKE